MNLISSKIWNTFTEIQLENVYGDFPQAKLLDFEQCQTPFIIVSREIILIGNIAHIESACMSKFGVHVLHIR